MNLADTLSRSYLSETKENLVPDISVNDIHLISYLPVSPIKYEEFKKATANDAELQSLLDTVLEGWPDSKAEVPDEIRMYWNIRDEISCVDGLLFKSHKLIIPQSMRTEMLNLIHSSHLGIVKCKSRSKDVMYWPGMSKDIEKIVSQCEVCAQHSTSNPKEPLIPLEVPDRPWANISADIFEYENQQYLVSVDHYSKWPEVVKLPGLSSYATIQCLKSQFSRNGLPDKVLTDNGPQFSSKEFRDFSKEYSFVHVTSSLHLPQANGQAERTVRTVKNLLRKAKDPYKSLLDYRNTNIEEIGLSPAQMFLGRRLKTDLPTASPLLSAATSSNDLKMRMETRKTRQKLYFDRHAGRELRPLHSGEKIVIKHGKDWIPGNVMSEQSNRSYIVKTNDGTKYRRNRKHIRPTAAQFKHHQSAETEISDSANPTKTKETPGENLQEVASSPQSSDLPKLPETITRSSTIVTRSGRVVIPPKKFDDFTK
ncbi:uncharacterized protein K02A2.6-like [Saccostrea cucullata]|uniref:uncharacterized protein K02A2.6-like n=1 Tax=Saccostrea cuccullata TaxID=36930 RepID=UPI002ECFFDD3